MVSGARRALNWPAPLSLRMPISVRLRCLVFAALALGPASAEAKDTLLVGGAASARYIYTGAQRWSFFWELADSDLRIRAGGVLFHDRQLASSRLTTAVFAGGAVSAFVDSLRMPVGALQHTQMWRVAPRLEIDVDSGITIQPSSIAQVTAAGQSAAVGRPLLLLDGAVDALYHLRRNLLDLQLAYESLIHLGDTGVDNEGVVATGAIQAQGTWTRELSARHLLLARPLYRAMLAQTNTYSPVTGLIGAMAGWGFRSREAWRLTALVGLGRVINLPRSHLWPVEPLFAVEGSYRNRFNIWTLGFDWRVRENTYATGLPMRVIEGRAGWQQPLSSRRWRYSADLIYQQLRIGHLALGSATRDADTLRAVRLQGMVTCRVAGGWRVFAEAGVALGQLARGNPPPCGGDEPCSPTFGFSANTLLGVAYINASRVLEERVLDERVLNLVR
jgi:hypothetical protein